jgi:hypothetical protein
VSADLRERLGVTPGTLEHGRLLDVLRHLEPEPPEDVVVAAYLLLQESADLVSTRVATRLARPAERRTKGQVLVVDLVHETSWLSWSGEVQTDLALHPGKVLRVVTW